MIEIYRPALKRNCWEIPHGFIDQGETDKAAAIRELSEETGIVSEESDCIYLGQLAPDPGIIGGTISIFYARNGKLTSDSKSELGIKQLKFFDFPEIKDMIDSSVILDSITLTLPPESGSHNEMHNLVCGRISDEKDKGAVYAGI